MRHIMVLNDHETYTDLEGCAIVTVSDQAMNAIERGQMTIKQALFDQQALLVTTFKEGDNE